MIQKRDDPRAEAKNVLGGKLESCSKKPLTGFFRDGGCKTAPDDVGVHVVCARVTQEFLEFSREHGNDLATPVPEFGYEGLKAGDCWCLCAARWREALQAGCAPPVVLASTHERALDYVRLEDLQKHAHKKSG
jgi:uncharacterized protein (DUF2237 family)